MNRHDCLALSRSTLLLLAISFCVTSASAASDIDGATSANQYDDNRIDTLHYRAAAGKFIFSTSLENATKDERKDFSQGTQEYTQNYSYLSYSAGLDYGICDHLSFSISTNYLVNSTDDRVTTSTGSSTAYRFDGFGNPDLRLNYRLLGHLSGNKFADVFINFFPSLGDGKDASSSSPGNHLSGYTTVNAGVATDWIFGNDEFYAQGVIAYDGVGTYKATTSTNDEKQESAVLGTLLLRDRYHFNSTFSASFGLTFNLPFTVDYKYLNQSPEFDGESSAHFYVEPQLSVGWHVYDKVFLSAAYSFQSRTTTQKSTNGHTIGTDETDSSQQFLTLAGLFEF